MFPVIFTKERIKGSLTWEQLGDFLDMVKIKSREDNQEEPLYLGTAESEHIEMYLKAIWYLRESGDEVKVSTIAQLLNVTQPSVVQMLKKLDNLNLLRYTPREIEITESGELVGKQMVRNTRLLEVLMRNALKIEVDEEMVCGIEHHMKLIFTEALCTLLNHPRHCPHGHEIPRGACCL